ncbi:uncharacterized protein SPSK_08072 [Sporothrix schenckii 1099-18]|uniref:Uncharacterized protein n=1 Tax=Sporothrix schenckii 1099-18 TaxID=1397361 RepID=A0A0F2MH14_SPOSC|nr:uncharacterized protein SPSK_08072 [Sporothrix schenckii 1099-18]KJR88973.1 hypothetical protein SPSK_08072 [Sporothrix schenckii 1099-18]
MKLLLHFLFALLAATLAVAAPTSAHLQRPIGSAGHHRNPVSRPSPNNATPVPSHTRPGERPKAKAFQLPYVVKAPKADGRHQRTSRVVLPSWMTPWRKAASTLSTAASTSALPAAANRHRMHFTHSGNEKLACFCAGGAVCCHTATGLDCNSGYCGI